MQYWWYFRAKPWIAANWAWAVAACVACLVALRLRRKPITPEQRARDIAEIEDRDWQRRRTEAHVVEGARQILLARAEEAARRAREAKRDADAIEAVRLAERERVSRLSATELSAELRRLSEARKARRGLRLVLLGALTLGSAHAEAQDARPMVGIDGTAGWWISDVELRDIVAESSAYHLSLKEGDSLRLSIDLCNREALDLRQAVDALQDAHNAAEDRAFAAEAGLADAKRKARVWWRRPGVWLGVGFAIGAGSVTALAVSL